MPQGRRTLIRGRLLLGLTESERSTPSPGTLDCTVKLCGGVGGAFETLSNS